MAEDSPRYSGSRSYFSYSGWLIAVIFTVKSLAGFSNRTWDTLLIWQVIAVAAMTAAFAGSAVSVASRFVQWFDDDLEAGIRVRSPFSRLFKRLTLSLHFCQTSDKARFVFGKDVLHELIGWAASAVYVTAALTLMVDSHRRFLIVVSVLMATAMHALRRPNSPRAFLSLLRLSITTWALTSGLTYTNLADWLLNSTASALAVAAFVASVALVLTELCDGRLQAPGRATPRLALAGVLLVFVAFAFRSDNLLDSWVPYHRSFVADVAQLVRDGYWLLWDIPSVYGLLSVLSVAIVPAKNAWQGLFILTSAILVLESCIIFTLWRWGRTGWLNLIFAVWITLATFGDSVSRYPWSPRLYPQGALRLHLVLALLATTFFAYVWRENRRRVRALMWAGHGFWIASLFWSFEAAVWSTAVWLPYVVLSAVTIREPGGVWKRLALYCWPLVALPIVAIALLELVYRLALGHPPDLFAFAEFTGLFVSGTVHAAFPLNPNGAGWCIVLVLGAVGSVALAAVREAQWATVPLLATTWLAVWATSTYYAVEPFDGHVAVLLGIMIPAMAIVTYVSREALHGIRTALYARLSAAPIAIVCMAFSLGEPSRLVTIKFPFMPGWTSDTLQELPPISGELAGLTKAAGIRPGDGVLIPNRQYWTEIGQGMLFPVTRTKGGQAVSYRAWVPLSPLGVQGSIMGLSAARRQTYIERHLERSAAGGWYIEYRAPAVCSRISPTLVTRRTVSSVNYSASLCVFEAKTPRRNQQS